MRSHQIAVTAIWWLTIKIIGCEHCQLRPLNLQRMQCAVTWYVKIFRSMLSNWNRCFVSEMCRWHACIRAVWTLSQRSHVENTGSRPISAVKQLYAWLVGGLDTAPLGTPCAVGNNICVSYYFANCDVLYNIFLPNDTWVYTVPRPRQRSSQGNREVWTSDMLARESSVDTLSF